MASSVSSTGGMNLDAGTVMSLAEFLNPSGRRLRIFTTEDVVKESGKIREQARTQVATNREVEQDQAVRLAATEDKNAERNIGGASITRKAPTINATAPDGSVGLNSFAFARRV